MNPIRFQALLDTYGAAPERWPADQRQEALTLARSSIEAARALANARALDAALRNAPYPDITDDSARFASLHARIISAVRPQPKGWISRWLDIELTPTQLWPSAAGLAAAMIMGFLVGMGGLIDSYAPVEQDDSAVPLFETTLAEFTP